MHGSSDCINGNLCVTMPSFLCTPGVLRFKPCLGFPRKVSRNPSEELEVLQTTADNQCLHVDSYTSSVALLVWPLPADLSHQQVDTTLPRLTWRFCCPALSDSKICSGCTSSRLCCLLLFFKTALSCHPTDTCSYSCFLGPSRLSSCIMTTCLERLLTAVLLTCGQHCTHITPPACCFTKGAPHADVVMQCETALYNGPPSTQQAVSC